MIKPADPKNNLFLKVRLIEVIIYIMHNYIIDTYIKFLDEVKSTLCSEEICEFWQMPTASEPPWHSGPRTDPSAPEIPWSPSKFLLPATTRVAPHAIIWPQDCYVSYIHVLLIKKKTESPGRVVQLVGASAQGLRVAR